MKPLIFQSDFGLADGAVSAMHGVAFSVCPDLNIQDLTHEIPQYDIWEASYRLTQTIRYWMEGTVFVSVVDPGVGSDRRSVVAKTMNGVYIVTPDNGTLTHIKQFVGITELREIDERVNDVLDKVGLSSEQATRFPHQFSGGQRQRVGIARALVMNPKLVIADECISALDVSIQAQVVNLMRDIQDEMGTTYLFIAHDLSMVKYISDRIGVMHLGHIVETGTTDEIFENPIHPYTKSLLSAIPHPNPIVEKQRKSLSYNKDEEGVIYENGHEHILSETHKVLATDEEFAKWTANS